jgi:hypothetical protein
MITYIYNNGDKIYDITKKKSGIIKSLINNNEKKHDKKYQIYYYISYDDGTFNTNVNVNNLIKVYFFGEYESNHNILPPVYSNYIYGQRFYNKSNQKYGTIKYLRDDCFEKYSRKINPLHYYYYVNYDDGTFNTYENGSNLIII